ncbi:MAG: glycosyltransferase family 4 protein [Flavobacteriales bacterium]
MKPKLLLIASNSAHVVNYYYLIKDYFSDILVISNSKISDTTVKCETLDFALGKVSNHFSTPKKIKEITLRFKPDVVHVHQLNVYSYYTVRALKKIKIPLLLTAWGSDVLLLPHSNRLMKKMVQYNIKHADALTADAQFVAEEIKSLVPSNTKNILVANFGIGIEPQIQEKENIIYSNRLHKSLYRIDKVIDAFAKFSSTSAGKNWKLVVAGSGENTAELITLKDKLQLGDKVQFVGWVNKEVNASWYAKAKIFVSIPESDATAISLLEAMACSCLPVLSDLPANKEWINDGENGLIVKNIDEDFFSRALQADLAKANEINKKLIEEHGTKAVNRLKFISLYDKLLANKK